LRKGWIAERMDCGKDGLRKGQRGADLTFPGTKGKAIASRYCTIYQLLTGHAFVAPYLKEKLKKTDSEQCWWCETGKRQTRDHLFKSSGGGRLKWTTIEAGVEAPQEQEDIRVVQGGEGNGGSSLRDTDIGKIKNGAVRGVFFCSIILAFSL